MSEKKYKWEIEPHPYDSQYDVFVTDSDEDALNAILFVAESHLWDTNDGGTRTLKVTHNAQEPLVRCSLYWDCTGEINGIPCGHHGEHVGNGDCGVVCCRSSECTHNAVGQ